jgi:predicted ATP-dependent endonuclease of OLD family
MEGVTRVRTPLKNENTTVAIDEKGFDNGFELGEISAGSQEILVLLTKIVLAEENTDLLVMEEPELHLHPGAQQEVLQLIKDVADSDTPQVIISTHSEEFVDSSDATDIFRVERDKHTTIRTVSKDEVDNELEDLGYEKSGLLQSNGVIFVEGKSDELIIKQFAQTVGLDLDRKGIEVVELDGDGNIESDGRSLIKLLYAFDIPYLFIVDSHGESPDDVVEGYVEEINCRKGDWHTTPEYFFAWPEYSIETYLLEAPEAISSVLDVEVDRVQETIRENEDAEDKAEILEELFQQELDEEYRKKLHGKLIAKHMTEAQIHEDVQKAIDKIRSQLITN